MIDHRSSLFLSPFAAAALAYLLTPVAIRLSIGLGAVDQPDPRKIHQQPMPRLGGLAIIAAAAIVLGAGALGEISAWSVSNVLLTGVVVGLLPIAAVSLIDDVKPVRAWMKLVCHTIGACAAVWSGIVLPEQLHILGQEITIGIFAVPLSIVWLIGVTNAFNIIDGLDGLAAGLAFISALAASAVLVTEGQLSSVLLPLILAGAIVGFLPYNMYPARVFLGDTGATAIGFTLAAVALKGGAMMSAGFAVTTPILLMGLPIADTLVAIVRRSIRFAETRVGGVFEPDRNHLHHRLLAIGLSHRRAVLVLYGLGALTATVAYVSLFMSSRESALMLLALFLAGAIGLKRLGYDEFALLQRGTLLRLYEAPVLRLSMFVVVIDIAFICISCYLAVALKTDDWLLRSERALVLQTTAALVPLSIVVFWKARLYEGSWRLATIDDYVRATAACGTALFLALVIYAWELQLIPASVLVLYSLVSAFLIVGSRTTYRVLVSAQRAPASAGTPVLLYGPGPDDFIQARDVIDRAGSFGLKPIGFVTSAGLGRGQLLAGLKILGSLAELPTLARASGARAAVLARRRLETDRVDAFQQLCRTADIVAYRLNTELEILGDDEAQELTAAAAAGLADRPVRGGSGMRGWPTYATSNARDIGGPPASDVVSSTSYRQTR